MDSLRPIIIKRRKSAGGEGHHGGAWKVAYADFVTAMMAFFLLMWLLNATTEDQRKGIAEYFDPAIPIAPISGGGTDMLSGDTTYATDSLAHSNHGGAGEREPAEVELIDAVSSALSETVSEDQFRVTLSDEGVVVELLEAEDTPLFALGDAAPSTLLRDAMEKLAPLLRDSQRPVKFIGHTDAIPYRPGSAYSNWELSADRANAARRLAEGAGLEAALISDVVGKADTMPLVEDRSAPENRRISIIIQYETERSIR